MDPQEIKDKLLGIVNNLIRDTDESRADAQTEFHDVLAAKMRDRINPEAPASTPEPDVTVDADDDTPPADDATEITAGAE